MGFETRFDVFIAYHGSHAEDRGSKKYAEKVYDELTAKGYKCFFFPKADKDMYKTNIFEVLSSKTFIFVCTDDIKKTQSGQIDVSSHYELMTEIDSFWALIQNEERSPNNVKVLAFGDFRKGSETHLHKAFDGKKHFYYPDTENPDFTDLFDWLRRAAKSEKRRSWQQSRMSMEIKQVFASRESVHSACNLDDKIADARSIKAVGISNWELTDRADGSAVKHCIENDGEVEILFLDPDGVNTPIREKEENLPENKIKEYTDTSLSAAAVMWSRMRENRESFQLYLYDKIPRMNMIFLDTWNEEKGDYSEYLVLQYYANKVAGLENPTFLIERQEDNSHVFEHCLKAYEHLREGAVRISDEELRKRTNLHNKHD